MRRITILYVFLMGLTVTLCAQVSHGGKPLPFISFKSGEQDLFKEMPSFDVNEELRLDSLNGSDLKSGYRFAYKFITEYDRSNSGVSFTLADGTKVWRLGIRSQGALSINVLFTEYDLPEGAQLFLYNKDQSHILGAFNHLNNSDLQLLPVSPVQGDELIIEYQEPANASFPGKITVGEVNHAYRSLRGVEPKGDLPAFECMPPVICFNEELTTNEPISRSTVLVIIDGTISCSGVMVNNTASDGKPYLLTASHCLNNNFSITNPDYEKIAGSIVCYFNYESPLCDIALRGTEEMSVASAKYIAVNENNDMTLLELMETPPVYYQPYYAGWNATGKSEPPYYGIHHPSGASKRINISEEQIVLSTFISAGITFDENVHWKVPLWTVGSTHGGSSGSPLFDKNGLVVGALTGGESNCAIPANDYYYALSKAWKPEDDLKTQLQYWLNPTTNTTLLSCNGLDPYASNSAFRLSNIRSSGKLEAVDVSVVSDSESAPLFGNNSSEIIEYAEEYNALATSLIYGAYFITPSAGENYRDLKVEVTVYNGENGPDALLHTEIFQPTYTNKEATGNIFQETIKSLDRSQESFIQFNQPIQVKGKFYIGYKIVAAPKDTYFCALNLPEGEVTKNTTWLYYNNQWLEATQHPLTAFKTSLYIDPVLQYKVNSSTNQPTVESPIRIYQGMDRRTVHIHLPEGMNIGNLTIYSMSGQIMNSYSIQSNQSSVSIGSCPSGVYIVKVSCADISCTQKVVF